MFTEFVRRRMRHSPVLRRILTPARAALAVQLLQFGTVGVAGAIVNTAAVYALRGWLGVVGAGIPAYVAAATTTWALNRAWTFGGRSHDPLLRQWAMFLAASLAGFVLYFTTYVALVTSFKLCADNPVLAVAAGAIVGMFANFGLSRQVVFRNRA